MKRWLLSAWILAIATPVHANPVDMSCYVQLSGQTINLSHLCGSSQSSGSPVRASSSQRNPSPHLPQRPVVESAHYGQNPQQPTVDAQVYDGRGTQGTRVDATLHNGNGTRIDLTDRRCDPRRNVDSRYDINATGQLCGY
jgi:hypothetical protein